MQLFMGALVRHALSLVVEFLEEDEQLAQRLARALRLSEQSQRPESTPSQSTGDAFGCSSHRDVFARRGLRSGFGVMSMTLAST